MNMKLTTVVLGAALFSPTGALSTFPQSEITLSAGDVVRLNAVVVGQLASTNTLTAHREKLFVQMHVRSSSYINPVVWGFPR